MKQLSHSVLRKLLVCVALTVLFTVAALAADTAIGIGIVITDGGLWLREGPDSSYAAISAASEGDDVVVYAEEGDWYRVNYNLQVGYMKKDYLLFYDRENVLLGDGVVVDGLVNLRGAPSSDGELLAQLDTWETASIIGLNNGWYKVEYKDYTGYIRSDLLVLTDIPVENSLGYYETTQSYAVLSAGESVAEYAKSFIGTPYVWGGSSPGGFDCSGLCYYVYAQMGYSINRVANDQMSNGYSVSYSDLQPGDLVFFGYGGYAGHVGIYVGDGNYIHAPQSGDYVKISSLAVRVNSGSYLGARRIVG